MAESASSLASSAPRQIYSLSLLRFELESVLTFVLVSCVRLSPGARAHRFVIYVLRCLYRHCAPSEALAPWLCPLRTEGLLVRITRAFRRSPLGRMTLLIVKFSALTLTLLFLCTFDLVVFRHTSTHVHLAPFQPL